MNRVFFCVLIVISFSACIVKVPKYTNVEEVLTLRTGMTKDSIDRILGVKPHDVKSISDSEMVVIYVYRTTVRKIATPVMKERNGTPTKGKWVDLFITYGNDGKAKNIESCTECEVHHLEKSNINLTPILASVASLVLPTILVFVGLQNK